MSLKQLFLVAAALILVGMAPMLVPLPVAAQRGSPQIQQKFTDNSTNGATKLVVGVSGKTIYVYSVFVSTSSSTTNTVSFEQGNGTNCGSNTTVISPAWPVVASATVTPSGFVLPSSGAPWFWTTTPGMDLCVLTTAGQSLQTMETFAQF